MTLRRSDRQSHPMQAFRVDPGWYAEHWLEETPARPPGLPVRLLVGAMAFAAMALRNLRHLARRTTAPALPPAGRSCQSLPLARG
jgi:hypothetical protein